MIAIRNFVTTRLFSVTLVMQMLSSLHNHNVKILEKDDKCFMLYFFRTQLNEAYIANVSFTKSAITFICCPELLLLLFF